MRSTNAESLLPPAPAAEDRPGSRPVAHEPRDKGGAPGVLRAAGIAVAKIVGLAAVYWCWQAAAGWTAPLWAAVAVVWGGVALVPLLSLLWRGMLDRKPTPERAALLSFPLHYLLMALLGCALIVGWTLMRGHPFARVPFPQAISEPLLKILAILAVLAVLNLAVRGLGLPFAAVLSRKLATGWMYAHSRNPMLLATLLGILDGALWMQSLHALLWTMFWLTPAMILYVRIYEERELEVRFGEAYVQYKERTPFFA